MKCFELRWAPLLLVLAACSSVGIHFPRSALFEVHRTEGAERIEDGTCRVGDAAALPTTQRFGHLSTRAITSVIEARFEEYKDCYEDLLERGGKRRGTVFLDFTVAPDGTVSRSKASSDELEDDALLRCIVDLSCGMKFPEPEGDASVTVSYPFAFTHDL